MTSIESIFIKQGSPIEAEDIQLKDIVAIQWAHTDGLTVEEWSKRSEVSLTAKYRLVYRPVPELPTSPGSIIGSAGGIPVAVLAPDLIWYSVTGDLKPTKSSLLLHLVGGTCVILLDTGAI